MIIKTYIVINFNKLNILSRHLTISATTHRQEVGKTSMTLDMFLKFSTP